MTIHLQHRAAVATLDGKWASSARGTRSMKRQVPGRSRRLSGCLHGIETVYFIHVLHYPGVSAPKEEDYDEGQVYYNLEKAKHVVRT